MTLKLWEPSPERIANANVTAFARAIEAAHGVSLPDQHALWRWSVANKEAFWRAVWDDGGVIGARGERTLWHEPWALAVDLHTALVEPGYSFAPPPQLAFAAPSRVPLAGRAIPTLEPELLWVWQCLHGA